MTDARSVIYDVASSAHGANKARELGHAVIIRLCGTLYEVDARGAVRSLDINICAEIESKIALRVVDVVSL